MSDKPKYRRVKNREPFATTIKLGYGSIIDELSSETRIAKSKLVDEALELLFEKHKKDYNNIPSKS
ncbi:MULTISPECIES: ribbon-helix-helix domain-containing protein [Clostridium]|uniref:Ribbon-helix-helix domain n=1 Tax=Clostridium disporicum TaxID=84024 RepID=A0A174J308_9CLOT|nr:MULTISPECIES: ribbon-helix-helix domain-containing protein [Clostridium]CUO94114.1 Ribbon-helix-helix domain [Clostridium disporicum]